MHDFFFIPLAQLPAEVRASESHAQRSKTTGHLVVVMPKARICLDSSWRRCRCFILHSLSPCLFVQVRPTTTLRAARQPQQQQPPPLPSRQRPQSLAEAMLREGERRKQQEQPTGGAVSIRGIVDHGNEDVDDEEALPPLM